MTEPDTERVPGVCSWTAHPARTRPRDVALVFAVLFITAGVVLTAFQSLLLCALSLIILTVSVAAFLFPTHYALTDAGVEVRRFGRPRFRRWADLRRLSVGPGAALVSPFARPTWLDRYRGLLLLLDGADRDRVVRILEDRIAKGDHARQ